MEKNGGGGVGENTHELEKTAKMLEKINTIMVSQQNPCGGIIRVLTQWLLNELLQDITARQSKRLSAPCGSLDPLAVALLL